MRITKNNIEEFIKINKVLWLTSSPKGKIGILEIFKLDWTKERLLQVGEFFKDEDDSFSLIAYVTPTPDTIRKSKEMLLVKLNVDYSDYIGLWNITKNIADLNNLMKEHEVIKTLLNGSTYEFSLKYWDIISIDRVDNAGKKLVILDVKTLNIEQDI